MSGLEHTITGEHKPSKRDLKTGLPIKFRLSKDPSTFHYSASSQPDIQEYEQLFAKLAHETTNQIYIFDLRDEEHVFINDSESVAFEDPELRGLESLSLNTTAISSSYKTHDDPDVDVQEITISKVQTEEDFVQANRHSYKRLPIENHSLPKENIVDELINFVREHHDEPVWIHFHCHGGNARSALMSAIMVLVTLKLNGTLDKLDKGIDVHDVLELYLDKESFKRIYKDKPATSPEVPHKTSSNENLRSGSPSDDESLSGKHFDRQIFMQNIFDYVVNDMEHRTWSDFNNVNDHHHHI